MKKITFNKAVLLITLFAILFLYGEFEYKKSHYFKENIYNLELQYHDKVSSYKSVADFWASKNEFVGLFDVGIDGENLLSLMDKNLNSYYTMAIRRDYIEQKMEPSNQNAFYHESGFDKRYVIHNAEHAKNTLNPEVLKALKNQIDRQLDKEHSFALYRLNGLFTSSVFVFVAVYDLEKRHVGYIISKRDDSYINQIYAEQFLKFLSFLAFLYIVRIFYWKQVHSKILLEQYKSVVDQTTLLSKTDTKGRIIYVNKVFESLSGYSAKELIGKAHSIVRHPDMPASVFKELWQTISSGKSWHGKIKNRKKDGSAYIVDAAVFPITDEEGKIVEYIAIRHDVTELEELKELLEKELQASGQSLEEKMSLLAQYEKAIEQSASYTRTDTEGIITYLNKTHEVLTGFTKDELIGTTHKLMRDPATPPTFYKELWDTIQQKKVWKGIVKNRNKEGDFFFLDTTIVPILDKDEAILEYMSIQYDVTELLLLQEEIVATQREVIYTMGEIAETRSKETGNHVKRVAEYVKLLALKSGMSEEEANLLYAASPMHDIGKVGIPDSILNKPGKLDNDEWEIMRAHGDIGHNILKSSERPIMKAAAIVAYEHHEKWDGTGYPRRIKGDKIHIYGRITAIADVFDALSSDRVYKKAWELEKVLELFRQESGVHFDPALVEIFFDNLSEFLLIRDSLKD